MENTNESSKEEKKQDEKLTPRELVNKILEDPNHLLTDDEIRNLKTGSHAENEPEREKQIQNKLDELKTKGDNKLINPYDVLDSDDLD